ncbi:MAG: hypothetical protein AAGI08_04055 [Bacteroidota bacterium]
MRSLESPDLHFEGFTEEAFGILDRLKAEPHIEQYRQEKPAVKRHLTEPFKRYRDDLVVHWVIPDGLAFETEKNVFSRLLKNDFGAGGCHHNIWMSFYRPGRRRLKDAQLSHSISPDGFSLGFYVGDYATDCIERVRTSILEAPETTLDLVNPLLAEDYSLYVYSGKGKAAKRATTAEPVDHLLEGTEKLNALWLRRIVPREGVLRLGPELVFECVRTMRQLWPFYTFALKDDVRAETPFPFMNDLPE